MPFFFKNKLLFESCADHCGEVGTFAEAEEVFAQVPWIQCLSQFLNVLLLLLFVA
jgi:flagellar biogenesis protein FliO